MNFEWKTADDDLTTTEVDGARLEVWAECRGGEDVYVWDVYVWDGIEGDWYHHDSGVELNILDAKQAAELALQGEDDDMDGDDMDGDHGTALMSAGYGDEAYGYECGEWL